VANDNLVLDDLQDELKDIRKKGYLTQLQNAFILQGYMGCENASTEHIASCFVKVVRHFVADKEMAELILATSMLLKDYEAIDEVGDRYKKFYEEIWTGKKTADYESLLRSRSNTWIERLAKCIVQAGDLSEIVKDASDTQKKTVASSVAPEPIKESKFVLLGKLFGSDEKEFATILLIVYELVMAVLAVMIFFRRLSEFGVFGKILVPLLFLLAMILGLYFYQKFVWKIKKRAKNKDDEQDK